MLAQAGEPPLRAVLIATEPAPVEPYSTGEVVAGGLAGTFLGLGIGHAVQGRFAERGWIFTVGETTSLAAYTAGVMSCGGQGCSRGLLALGAVGLVGFRIWEVADVWITPVRRNAEARRSQAMNVAPYALLTGTSSGVAGIAVRF